MMTKKEAYRLCCMWQRIFKRGVHRDLIVDLHNNFCRHGFAMQWDAAKQLYSNEK